MKTWLKTITLGGLFLVTSLYADVSFKVEKIKVDGLQRISKATLLHYLPIKQGQQLYYADTANIVKKLYSTGFFSNITLSQQADTLLIKVQERPTISAITVTGNQHIPKDKFNDALKKLGLQVGYTLNPAVLQQVIQALRDQYYSIGRYNVHIDLQQTQQTRNRVAIAVDISEGAVAKIANIKIIGNRHYFADALLKALYLRVSSLGTFFTHRDQYSVERLQQSQQDIEHFYMNHGYFNVKVDHSVTITPDRKHVYLIFKITEGSQYRFSGYHLKGKLVNKIALLNKAISVKKGDIFSQQTILDSSEAMTAVLSDNGYAFARVVPMPKVNDESKTVFINFIVKPGRQYYIRHINFVGNHLTSELALRRQLSTMEGSLFSAHNVNQSIRLLKQNPYLDATQPPQVQPEKVPGKNDLLDLDVAVAEGLPGEIQLSLGYSQVYGLFVNTGIKQTNFMGTGKTVGFNIGLSKYEKSVSFNYINPYYTPDGISRSISFYASHVNADELQRVSAYKSVNYGININYGFPISVFNTLNLGYGLAYTHLVTNDADQLTRDFVSAYGDRFEQLLFVIGWEHNTEDVPYFPNKGTRQSIDLNISAPVSKRALQYYTLTYTHDWFQPLNSYFTLHMHGVLGYGDGYGFMKKLPFFQNYYAGGLDAQGVNRAYSPYGLGPKVDDKSIGGNLLVSGTANLILPDFFHNPNIRTSIFLDAGNVFDAHKLNYRFKISELRYSYGVQLQWRTPIGLPLVFSLAAPLNKKASDEIDSFQFTIGTVF